MRGLDKLIWPITRKVFEEHYWERQPLIVSREQRKYYDDLLSLPDLDEILSLTNIATPQVRLLLDGKVVPQSELGANSVFGHVSALDRLYAQLGKGATVNFVAIHERWRPLRDLCRTLSEQFSAAFQVNAYLTPPSSCGLNAHYDTHDVFVLQTYGLKKWRLFETPAPLPLRGDAPEAEVAPLDEPCREFELRAGDMMYLPRGWKHVAWTSESMSLHLTVGVYPLTWATVLLNAVEEVIVADSAYREALPIGFASEDYDRAAMTKRLRKLMAVMRERMDPEALIAHAADAARFASAPFLDGQLLDIAGVSPFGLDTLVRVREKTMCWLSTEDGRAIITFNGKRVSFPDYVATQLEFIVAAVDAFTPATLAGELDTNGRLVLVERLLKEGLLTVVAAKVR